MSTLSEIEAAIAKLPAQEFRELVHRLNERDAAEWDRQIEADGENGNLDRLYSLMIKEEPGGPEIALNEVLDDPELS